MRYSTEWHGHKIEWEVYSPKDRAFLTARQRLFIDGVEHSDKNRQLGYSATFKTTFTHEEREVPAEIYIRGGFYGVLTKIKVDGDEIARKYVSWFRMKNGVISVAVNLILGAFIALILIYSLFFLKQGIKPTILPKLNLKEVPGVIYFADTFGNIIAFEPSTQKYDTIYSNDSMAVRSLSKDLNSVLLVYPKEIEVDETPLRKVYWLTLGDGVLRLLGEWPMAFTYASFTPEANRAFFSIGDRHSFRSIVVDTLGNADTVDMEIDYPSPSGDKFLGRKKRGSPVCLFNIADGEITELDTAIVPKGAFVKWWSEDTLIIQWSYRQNNGQVIFTDLNSFESDTFEFPISYSYAYFRVPANLTVLTHQVRKITLGLSFIDKFEVYDLDKLIWETNSYTSYSSIFLSPHGDYLLIEPFSGLFEDPRKGRKFRIISEKGTSKVLDIEGRILFWK